MVRTAEYELAVLEVLHRILIEPGGQAANQSNNYSFKSIDVEIRGEDF